MKIEQLMVRMLLVLPLTSPSLSLYICDSLTHSHQYSMNDRFTQNLTTEACSHFHLTSPQCNRIQLAATHQSHLQPTPPLLGTQVEDNTAFERIRIETLWH
jgi:hypothetical protein